MSTPWIQTEMDHHRAIWRLVQLGGTVTFGTTKHSLSGWVLQPVMHLTYQCNSPSINCQCNYFTVFKSGTLSLYLSVPVPVLTPSVVISRPTILPAGLPLHLTPLLLRLRFGFCWRLCAFTNYIYLLTYLQRIEDMTARTTTPNCSASASESYSSLSAASWLICSGSGMYRISCSTWATSSWDSSTSRIRRFSSVYGTLIEPSRIADNHTWCAIKFA